MHSVTRLPQNFRDKIPGHFHDRITNFYDLFMQWTAQHSAGNPESATETQFWGVDFRRETLIFPCYQDFSWYDNDKDAKAERCCFYMI